MWIVALTAAVVAAGPYSVFNPTPDSELRDMATDRPDMTESAISVDAGHVQVELDLGVLALSRPWDGHVGHDDVCATFMAANVKIGLLSSVDLQLLLPALDVASKNRALSFGSEGVGARLKWNLLGNDGGAFQLALMPFVTHRFEDGAVEGGVIVPFAFELPAGFALAMMGEADAIKVGKIYDLQLVWTTSVAHDLPLGFGAYLEGAAFVRPYEPRAGQVAASSGVTWAPFDNVQFDGGARAFVVGADQAVEGFLGVTVRR